MRLQQLRYAIAVAEEGSINAAAHRLFVSQSSLSVAVRDLEQEMGIRIFARTTRGVSVTSDGAEFLSYARQVLEQADLLESRYQGEKGKTRRRLAVSSQHYAFVVNAFSRFVRECDDGSPCELTLRETRTAEIISDVAAFRADLGILYLGTSNERALSRRLDEADLGFYLLFRARPHVFVHEGHPLAALGRAVRVQDLAPWPRYTFEQGLESSLYFSEEPLAALPHDRQIVVSDRATMTTLLRDYDGFLVSTGVRSDEMFTGIVSLPLETDEVMNVGYVVHAERRLSGLARSYLDCLLQTVRDFGDESVVLASR